MTIPARTIAAIVIPATVTRPGAIPATAIAAQRRDRERGAQFRFGHEGAHCATGSRPRCIGGGSP